MPRVVGKGKLTVKRRLWQPQALFESDGSRGIRDKETTEALAEEYRLKLLRRATVCPDWLPKDLPWQRVSYAHLVCFDSDLPSILCTDGISLVMPWNWGHCPVMWKYRR